MQPIYLDNAASTRVSDDVLALITDVSWVSRYVRMFGWAVPGDLKVFAVAKRDAGIAWAATRET